MIKKTAIIIAILAAISGCKSLVYKGNKLYEAGMYRQAAEYYSQALAEDPEDLEAKQGLTLARDKLIDKGLIDVRMLRLANNYTAAATRLEEIVRNQAEWQMKPNGAMANTQREELDYARQWLLDEAGSLSNTPYPDRFKLFEHNHRHLISNAQLASAMSSYYDTLSTQAKKKCNTLAKQVSGQRFYLKSFTEKYCLAWQTPKRLTVDKQDTSRYFAMNIRERIDIGLRFGNSIKGQYGAFISDLNATFNNSLWFYNQGAQQLSLTLYADADYYRVSNQHIQRKHYQQEVERTDPNNPDKTHTTEVTREFAYPVTVYDEKFDINISYEANLASRYIKGNASDSKQNKTRSHQADFEQLDITPLSPDFLNLAHITEKTLDGLIEQFSQDLTLTWKQNYCGQALGTNKGENILRCAKLEPKHDYINRWFDQHFGVKYADMKTLYGI
ncbi:tetratricopeptide repeat protein [Pseudoalteromonas sp. SCSIO 43201]|uniref:tetratricopeptide repeat protein n=1 Tax=Pseudoalteromonas TaxID=53246 RepID=UPI0020766462|nr:MULTISPECIES: tetratricopeptide repeat protein [Pseudoalteromonas]MDW7547461.1 tetratricopeptide repeat protein [Pseudoalteromonas peptidolytica]USD27885.1 tetratricopeptide repeat protein [Pseudoalteromonas sp. SCSIO 43201]